MWRTWRVAMADALYGPDGFYRRSGAPGRHFRTAAHAGAAWAAAIAELARRVDAGLGRPESFAVVDVGAGGGELLARLAAQVPERWRLAGVDVAPRPSRLPDRVDWHATPPADVVGVVLAVELLDVVPVDVVELTDTGPRLVEVSANGDEGLDGEPDPRDLAWLSRWWPLAEPGDRAEIGLPRDEMWTDIVGSVARGLAVAVDYAADPRRDVAGTLTGYRDGRQLLPVPDGRRDLTAHVLIESCLAATGGDGVQVSQRDALSSLGVSGGRPAYDGDPVGYVAALSAASEAAELLDRSGLGGFSWLLHPKGVPLPL